MNDDKHEARELTEEHKENQPVENIADLPLQEEPANQAKGGRNGNLQITQ